MTDSNTDVAPAPALPAKRGRGQPRVAIDLDRVRELAGLGMTATQIADRLMCSRRALFAAMQRDPEIREAMDQGLAAATETAVRTLWHMAIEEKSVACLIFWLKTRGGMTIPKQQLQVSIVPSGSGPTIDGHVMELAARQSAILDSPWEDEDVPDASYEIVEAVGVEPSIEELMK